MSEAWEFIFYIGLSKQIRSRARVELKPWLARLLDMFPYDASDIQYFLVKVVERIKGLGEKVTIARAIASVIEAVSPDIHQTTRHLKAEVHALLTRKNMKAIILIDTVEDYVLGMKNDPRFLKGLLKCAGQLHLPGEPVEIRLFLPAEIKRSLDRISSNPLKGLDNSETIVWRASDLACVAAQRYYLYLVVQRKLEAPTDLERELERLSSRSSALQFLVDVLPSGFSNGFGREEPPLTYILRHTQLLPRQMIVIFAEMMRLAEDASGSLRRRSIVLAVKSVEQSLVSEVAVAYRYLHRDMRDILRFVNRELPRSFEATAFEKTYRERSGQYFNDSSLRHYEALSYLV